MTLALAFDILAKDKASRELQNIGDVADRSGGKLKDLSGVGKAALGGLAGAAALAGLTVTKAFGDALQMSATEDKLAAQLGLSEERAEEIGNIAGDLYASAFGDSLGEVNTALGTVMRTFEDLDDDGLSRITEKALNLAEAFDIDVNDAVKRAGVLVRTGLAKDADEAFDLVVKSMQQLTPELRDELGDATTEYSKFFADLGISGSEMLALFSEADDIFTLDKTGDAIKEFTIRATDMSTASQEAFDAIGMNAEDMARRLLAGGDEARIAFDEIVTGLLGIEDPVLQANTAIALFGTPLEDLGVNEIPAFLGNLGAMETGLGNVGGAAEAMGDTLNDNAATKIEEFKRSALQGLTNFIADEVIPELEHLGEVYQEDGIGGVFDLFTDEYLPGIVKIVDDWMEETGVPTMKRWASTLAEEAWDAFWDAISNLVEDRTAGDVLLDVFKGDVPGIEELRERGRPGNNASGTDFWRGGLSWVGEDGPELVNLPRGSQVIPSNTSLAMMASGGSDLTALEGVNEAQLLELRQMVQLLAQRAAPSSRGLREMQAAI